MKHQRQIKIAGTLDSAFLLRLGASYFGRAKQSDTYLLNKKMWRIREESGQYILEKKNYKAGSRGYAQSSLTSQSVISEKKAANFRKKYGILVSINKNRNVYTLGETIIALDEVEHLGNFIEILSSEQKEIHRTIKKLKLEKRKVIRESYIDLVLKENLPNWLKKLIIFHQKTGELAFGITSGVLTTVGLLTGVNSATSSRLAVIASILVIAVADSCSDAFGMYMSKTSERGISKTTALRYAFGTIIGKIILPATFIIPLLFLPLNLAVFIDVIWGMIALAALTAEQALVAGKSAIKSIFGNLALALLIIILSTLAGDLAAKIK